jgi:hypothetical protein
VDRVELEDPALTDGNRAGLAASDLVCYLGWVGVLQGGLASGHPGVGRRCVRGKVEEGGWASLVNDGRQVGGQAEEGRGTALVRRRHVELCVCARVCMFVYRCRI